jgi:hypothetical protein
MCHAHFQRTQLFVSGRIGLDGNCGPDPGAHPKFAVLFEVLSRAKFRLARSGESDRHANRLASSIGTKRIESPGISGESFCVGISEQVGVSLSLTAGSVIRACLSLKMAVRLEGRRQFSPRMPRLGDDILLTYHSDKMRLLLRDDRPWCLILKGRE